MDHTQTLQTVSGLQPTSWIHDLICSVSFQFNHITWIKSEGLRKVSEGQQLAPTPAISWPGRQQNFRQASVIASVNVRSHTGLSTLEALRQEISSVSHVSVTLDPGDTVQQTLS